MARQTEPPVVRAFPQTLNTLCGDQGGMTLRDYFAAQALCGLLSRAVFDVPHCQSCCEPGEDPGAHYADIAYRYADALLAAREPKS